MSCLTTRNETLHPRIVPPEGSAAMRPELVSKLSGYGPKRRIRVNLDLADAGEKVIEFKGSVIWVNDATTGARVEVFYDFDKPGIVLLPGYFYRGEPFERLRITWAAQAAATMVLQIAADRPDDTIGIL